MGNVNAATLVKEFLGSSPEDKIRYLTETDFLLYQSWPFLLGPTFVVLLPTEAEKGALMPEELWTLTPARLWRWVVNSDLPIFVY